MEVTEAAAEVVAEAAAAAVATVVAEEASTLSNSHVKWEHTAQRMAIIPSA